MIKILGAISVVAASGLAGFEMTKELSERIKFLRESEQYAIYIKGELSYRSPTFEECFRGRGKIFANAAKYIGEGVSPNDAVRRAADEAPRLNKGDREIFYAYAEGMSSEETGGQIANVSLLITRLEERIREAESEKSVKGRLYKSGAVLLGCGVVILLL